MFFITLQIFNIWLDNIIMLDFILVCILFTLGCIIDWNRFHIDSNFGMQL